MAADKDSDRYSDDGIRSYTPVVARDKRSVKINETNMSEMACQLDITKDVPLKKAQSAYVLFGNEVSDFRLILSVKRSYQCIVSRLKSD